MCTGTVQVDAHNVMLTLCEFSYVALPFGIATAATIRVGNMLGAGNHASARRSGALPYLCSASFSICYCFHTCSSLNGLGSSSRFSWHPSILHGFSIPPPCLHAYGKHAPVPRVGLFCTPWLLTCLACVWMKDCNCCCFTYVHASCTLDSTAEPCITC